MYKDWTNAKLIERLNDKREELETIEAEDLRGRYGDAYRTVTEEYDELMQEYRRRTDALGETDTLNPEDKG